MVIIYLSVYTDSTPVWVDALLTDKYVLANKWIILEPTTDFIFYEKHEPVYGAFLKRKLGDAECQILRNVVDSDLIKKPYSEVKNILTKAHGVKISQWILQRIWKLSRSHIVLIDGIDKTNSAFNIFDSFLASLLNIPVILINPNRILDLSLYNNGSIVVLAAQDTKEIVRQVLAFTMVEELFYRK